MGSINLKVNPKIINSIYLKHAFKNDHRVQIYYGGSSSGKSFAIIGQRTVLDIMEGKRNYLIVRNTQNTIMQSVWMEVITTIEAWGLGKYFLPNQSSMTITCTLNNKQIIFRGLDDVQKIKSVRAKNGPITDIVIEEATELTSHRVFKELIKRQRGHSEVPKRITLLFNPIYQTHWIYKDFFAGFWKDNAEQYQERGGLSILKTTYKDNKYLTPEDIKDLEDETDPYYYNVYTLGNWGTLGHQIFTNWELADFSDLIPQFDNNRNGIDWGFGVDPFAFIRSHYDKKNKTIYIYKTITRTELSDEESAELVKPIVLNERVVCDSAEPKSVRAFQTMGIKADSAKKGAGSVEFGIKWLKKHRIIVQEGLSDMVNELTLYQWKEDKNGQVLPIPVDKNNHLIDALRYSYEDDMVQIGDTVYEEFNEKTEEFLIDVLPSFAFINIGIKFGTTVRMVCSGISIGYKEVVVLDAIEAPANQLEYAYIDFVKQCITKFGRVHKVYCDEDEQVQTRIVMKATQASRLPTTVQYASKLPITDRVHLTIKLQQRGRFKVHSSCKVMVKAFQDAMWDMKYDNMEKRVEEGTLLDAFEFTIERHLRTLMNVG